MFTSKNGFGTTLGSALWPRPTLESKRVLFLFLLISLSVPEQMLEG